MESKTVVVLGTGYKVITASEKEFPNRFDIVDGEIDESTKEVFVDNYVQNEGVPHTLKNKSFLVNKNIRHELIHAFLFESGLAENSSWAQNEEMVDWFARQFPKLLKVFNELDAI